MRTSTHSSKYLKYIRSSSTSPDFAQNICLCLWTCLWGKCSLWEGHCLSFVVMVFERKASWVRGEQAWSRWPTSAAIYLEGPNSWFPCLNLPSSWRWAWAVSLNTCQMLDDRAVCLTLSLSCHLLKLLCPNFLMRGKKVTIVAMHVTCSYYRRRDEAVVLCCAVWPCTSHWCWFCWY